MTKQMTPREINLSCRVDELEWSIRTGNCLQNANINYVGELVQKTETEMLKIKNFGRKSLKECREVLAELGLTFGMDLAGMKRLTKYTYLRLQHRRALDIADRRLSQSHDDLLKMAYCVRHALATVEKCMRELGLKVPCHTRHVNGLSWRV